MNTIHVSHIKSKHRPRASKSKPGLYESEAWVVATRRAEQLKGGKLFALESRDSKSFDGGTIIDFEEVLPKNGMIRMRFFYEQEKGCVGLLAPQDRWRNEYRISIKNELK